MGTMNCMMSGQAVEIQDALGSSALVVVQKGQIIGILCQDAQEGVKTIRMTFTRSSPESSFTPMQGQGIEHFRPDADRDDTE